VLGQSSKTDFMNEMGKAMVDGRVRSNGHPCPVLLETAIRGGSTLIVGHFISKIAVFEQKP
jgi:hypothetical protein